MDSSLTNEQWDWQPEMSSDAMLEEIAAHAENHPEWLELSGNVA
jgi:CDP-paratose 2-epimerase